MSLMSAVLGMHGHGRGPLGTWRLRSPPTPGSGSGATGHVAIPEPCRVVVLVPQSRGDARAFLRRGWAWSCETRGDSRALSCRVTGSVPRGTWQHRSPFLAGGVLGASGHVTTPEPSLGEWHALCHGARGDTGALSWWVACSVPQGTWQSQSSLAPGAGLEPWG
jgi:hypothetical protein